MDAKTRYGGLYVRNHTFFYFPLDLYRLGGIKDNEPWDKMDHVRHSDIRKIEFTRNVVTWLHPGPQGGISLFDDIKTAPIKGNHWFKIPKDSPDQSKLPPGLALFKGTEKKVKQHTIQYTPLLRCR